MDNLEKVMALYVEGTRTGNVKLLKSVFHESAVMSGDLGDLQMIVGTPKHFFDDVDGECAPDTYAYQIYDLVKCGNVATAKLKEFGLKGHDFVNMFQLQKIEGEWKIISKLFTTMEGCQYETL